MNIGLTVTSSVSFSSLAFPQMLMLHRKLSLYWQMKPCLIYIYNFFLVELVFFSAIDNVARHNSKEGQNPVRKFRRDWLASEWVG